VRSCLILRRVAIMHCEELERLTLAYLEATENSRNVSDSIDDIDSPEWRKATAVTRQASETALAALKLHIRKHKCRSFQISDSFLVLGVNQGLP
jgi:hypothetical protein